MTRIEHYRNSFISIISNDNKVLWCDPWLNGANGELWASAEISVSNFLSTYSLPDIVYISHIHDDHFDIEFLIKTFSEKEFKIIIPKGEKSYETMFRRLILSGIPPKNIYKIDFFEKTNIDKFDLVILPQYNQSTSKDKDLSLIDYDIDSSLLINIDSIQVFNQNDNYYNSENIQTLREKINSKDIEFKPDLSFIPYCAASCYPQSFLDIDRQTSRGELLKRIFNDCFLDSAKTINSGIYVPSGGTYSFCEAYNFIDSIKAVPTSDELFKLVNKQNQIKKSSIFLGNNLKKRNYSLTMLNLESDVRKKIEIMKSQDLFSIIDYKTSFTQASQKLNKMFNKLPLSLNIYLISYEDLEKSLKSGSSSDIGKYEKIFENKNPNSDKNFKIFLTPFCLRALINKSISWNAINFGAAFVREPNIYYPTVDMFLSTFFKFTSNQFLSNSKEN